jgi:hypothetical protein
VIAEWFVSLSPVTACDVSSMTNLYSTRYSTRYSIVLYCNTFTCDTAGKESNTVAASHKKRNENNDHSSEVSICVYVYIIYVCVCIHI